MKIWYGVLFLILADSAGNIFLTRGMKQLGDVGALRPRELLRIARRAVVNPMLLLGIFCIAIAFFTFLGLLAGADLSFVLPATSLAYVVSVFGAKYFLKEDVTADRWIGTMLICLGVALISLNSSAG
jgi:transporter family protein